MRIGGSFEREYKNPEEWLALVRELLYRAVIFPVNSEKSRSEVEQYLECCRDNDLLIGEVGVWNNPLAEDEEERKKALLYCKQQLALADEVGANCCVNIAGCHGEFWDGFHADNYTEGFYDMTVDSIREIIDSVKPKRTFYAIEPMPWMIPDSPDQYLQLIRDVDRQAFGVHLDFANMINCPSRYCRCAAFIDECFDKLGPYIKSVHAKDVRMTEQLPTCITECMPGTGTIDFIQVVRRCERLGKDMTVFIEHLPDFESYKKAAGYLRQQVKLAGI